MTTHMTHDAFNDQLLAYMENDLDDATRAAMDKHAQQCAECGVLRPGQPRTVKRN